MISAMNAELNKKAPVPYATMAAQMLKLYHLWVTLWSPGKFHTYECWHHNASGTPQYRKPYMKISVFGGLLILGEGVVDHRERWRNKGVGEDG